MYTKSLAKMTKLEIFGRRNKSEMCCSNFLNRQKNPTNQFLNSFIAFKITQKLYFNSLLDLKNATKTYYNETHKLR